MAGIERYEGAQGEELGDIIRRFASQSRAVLSAAVEKDATSFDANRWYQAFCKDVDHSFGKILYTYAKNTPGIRRSLVFSGGGNLPFDKEKLYGLRYWDNDGYSYRMMQIRQRNRRGEFLGTDLAVTPTLEHWVEGHVKILDAPTSQLELLWHRNPSAAVGLSPLGHAEYGGMSVFGALAKVVSVVESMPGILLPASGIQLPILDVPHQELPPR